MADPLFPLNRNIFFFFFEFLLSYFLNITNLLHSVRGMIFRFMFLIIFLNYLAEREYAVKFGEILGKWI
jgi:hypothetical protein